MSIATKCTCGYSVTGFCLDRIKECVNIIRGSAITHLHARTGENEVIRFAQWYSGMDVEKVKKAYQRYLVEQPPATPLAPENEAVGWIRVEDGLPPIGEEVNVYTINGRVTSLCRFIRYEEATEYFWDNRYGGSNLHLQKAITHWRPLPAPPPTSITI